MPGMSDDTFDKTLDSVLGFFVGRKLSVDEITTALQMSRSRYYNQRDEGRLITPTNLVIAAHNLGINEVALLVQFGFVRVQAAIEYVDSLTGGEPRADQEDDPHRGKPKTRRRYSPRRDIPQL